MFAPKRSNIPPVSLSASSINTSSPPVSPSEDKEFAATAEPRDAAPITPSFAARLRRHASELDPDIIEWIQRARPQSKQDIEKHYKKDGDKVLAHALRAFEVFIDPNTMFAPHRERWGIKKLVRIAVAHMDHPFENVPAVETYLANMEKTRGKFGLMKSKSKGSLDRLRLEVNLDTVLRFVRNHPTLQAIELHYEDSTQELNAALKMFEVLFQPDSIFAPFLTEWSDERKMVMAKRHAQYPMLNADAIRSAVADEDAALKAEENQASDEAIVQAYAPRTSEYGVFDSMANLSLR